jgi:uncharacterized peroxidase-related enzyme
MTGPRLLGLRDFTGSTAALIGDVALDVGFVPDLMRVLAHSPAALRSYLGLRAALKGASLPAGLRECIAIAVASRNGCHSCLVNHRHLARGAGVGDGELDAASRFLSCDPATAAALRFASAVIETHGHVNDAEFVAVRDAGFSDAAIVEIAVVIGANMLANFVNNLAHPTGDTGGI